MPAKLTFLRLTAAAYTTGVIWFLTRSIAALAEPSHPLPVKPHPPIQTASRRGKATVRRQFSPRTIYDLPGRGMFRRSVRMIATAYMPVREGVEGGRYTCTLRDGRASHGVAVDPRLIRLGSQLWVPGYGMAVADDVGRAIKGRHIDIRVQERRRMHEWGTRSLTVYVLSEPAVRAGD